MKQTAKNRQHGSAGQIAHAALCNHSKGGTRLSFLLREPPQARKDVQRLKPVSCAIAHETGLLFILFAVGAQPVNGEIVPGNGKSCLAR